MAGETRRVRKRTLRSRITPSDVIASANWISKCDRQICLDLYKHHVLTVHQLAKLHFSQPRRARKRLLQLYERGVLNRFQPRRASGSAPFHYVLGELGAHIVAGDGPADEFARDVLALTKMNWNNDALYDLLPTTLEYASTLARVIRRMPSLAPVPYPFRLFM
jgi:hypothetical protein